MCFDLAVYENIKKEGGERDINHSSEQKTTEKFGKINKRKKKKKENPTEESKCHNYQEWLGLTQ